MNTRHSIWLWVAVAAVTVGGEALACGETLFRTGTSMRQHMQGTQSPARILILADAGGAQFDRRDELHNGLRRAGHSVEEVSDADALAAALAQGGFDLVLAHQNEVPTVLSVLDSGEGAVAAASRPTLIPVLAEGQRSLEPFRFSVRQGAEVGAFLRTIARAMRESSH